VVGKQRNTQILVYLPVTYVLGGTSSKVCDQAMAIQFMKEIGLLQSKVQCNTCDQDMMWSADSNRFEGFRWRYQRTNAGNRCN